MCTWLQHALGADNSKKIVYLLTENEVYGKKMITRNKIQL